MPQAQLIAARPWDREAARDEMVDRATSTTGVLDDHLVGVLAEPLLTTVSGNPAQAVRIVGGDGVDPAHLSIRDATGQQLLLGFADAPTGSLRALVRAVTEPTPAIVSGASGRLACTIAPQRQWSVHLISHSHFDFGYTDPQSTVFSAQRSYLDTAMDLVSATATLSDDARFRWNAEALWAFLDWSRNRPPARVNRFLDMVRSGWIELSAMPFNLHTEICSTEELHELLRPAVELRAEHNLDLSVAMQTDVPGQVVGLVDALHDAGVRYLSVAHNWGGRGDPHTKGGLNLPRLFRWRSPSGKSIVVWMTDSAHGDAYMEGPMLGFTESYAAVDAFLPAYLTALATRGYPYHPGAVSSHGDEPAGRTPYPGDVLHLRTNASFADNSPAGGSICDIVQRWNQTWTSPRLRVSTNADFFREAEGRSANIETLEGDWGDWWAEGVGSAALPIAVGRHAQRRIAQARTISQLTAGLGGARVPDEDFLARQTYEAITLFDEHTWGASCPWKHGDDGHLSGERQWHWKTAKAYHAADQSDALVEHALSYLAETTTPTPDVLASYLMINTGNARPTATARMFIKASTVPIDQPFVVRDSRTDKILPHALQGQYNAKHREAGCWVTFQINDVPPIAVLQFDLLAADRPPEPSRVHDLRGDRDGLLILTNEFLTVHVDDRTATIDSITDRRTGHELVNQDSVVGFNAYIHDRYGTANHHALLSNWTTITDRLELLVSRGLAKPAHVIERVDDAVEQRLVYGYSADGVESVQVTLRLRPGEPYLYIENKIDKPSTTEKEGGYLAFPFAIKDPRVRYEISGGVTGDGIPHLPGAPQHNRAVRDWVSLAGKDAAVAWVTCDVPLVQRGAIAAPYVPFPATTSPNEPGTLYSWVHNNIWDTNFPMEQSFDTTFRYAIGVPVDSAVPVGVTAANTAQAVNQPLEFIEAIRPPADTGEPNSSLHLATPLIELDDPRVRVLSMLSDEQADVHGSSLLRMQSIADAPIRTRLLINRPVQYVQQTTPLGERPQQLTITASAVSLELQPHEIIGIRLYWS